MVTHELITALQFRHAYVLHQIKEKSCSQVSYLKFSKQHPTKNYFKRHIAEDDIKKDRWCKKPINIKFDSSFLDNYIYNYIIVMFETVVTE